MIRFRVGHEAPFDARQVYFAVLQVLPAQGGALSRCEVTALAGTVNASIIHAYVSHVVLSSITTHQFLAEQENVLFNVWVILIQLR